MRFALLILFSLPLTLISAQTLIINEVSNGPSGNKEYIELVVVDTSIAYDCNSPIPPCIDIRGWIFDDNSGYHGTSGVAPGAVRFSFDPLWACVPLGTIILVYNNNDFDVSIPPVDISMADGNCRIVAPINDPNLFQGNPTTPGAIACSYPTAGWVNGGNWTNTVLANAGDCARIVDLSGCEVFSVCFGSADLNTLIYFAGNGQDRVYYFNNGDPAVQGNWSFGCANDIAACGANFQTPGAPNNAANAAFISQFNNNCQPITPIVATTNLVNNEICGCDGSATVNATGSIPGYTYQWLNALLQPIGQTGTTATGLCDGTYYVVATSAIDCSDTSMVVIGANNPLTYTVSIVDELCGGNDGSISINASGGNASSYSYSIDGGITFSVNSVFTNLSAGLYNVVVQDASGCSISTTESIGSVGGPTINAFNPVPITCNNGCNGSASISVSGGVAPYTYQWLSASGNVIGSNSASINGLCSGSYSVEILDAVGLCPTVQFFFMLNPLPPSVNVVDNSPVCLNQPLQLNENAGQAVSWAWSTSGGGTFSNATIQNPTVTGFQNNDLVTVTITNALGCVNSESFNITALPLPTLISFSGQGTYCQNETVNDLLVALSGSPSYSLTYTLNGSQTTVSSQTSPINLGSAPGTYVLTGLSDASCTTTISGTQTITVNALPSFTVSSTNPTACNAADGTITLNGLTPSTNYQYSYSFNGANQPTVLATSSASGSILISGLLAGTYASFSVTNVLTGCIGTIPDQLTLTNPGAPLINDIADQQVCDSYTLPAITGTNLSGNQSYWTGTSASGTQLTVGTVITSTSTFYLYDAVGSCSNEQMVTITVLNTPSINNPGPQTACGSYNLPAITGLNLSGLQAYYDNTQANGGDLLVGPITSSQVVWIYDANGSCTNEISFPVTIQNLPSVVSMTGGGNFCEGEAIDPIEVVLSGNAPFTLNYSFNGIPQPALVSSTSNVFLGNSAGTYTLTALSDANCSDVATETQSIVINLPPPAPVAGTDTTYCENWTPVAMTAVGLGGTIQWYADNGLNSLIGVGNSQIPNLGNGSMTYFVTETLNGCEGPPNAVTITVEPCEIIVPTAFTPDGDGVNDDWQILDLDANYPQNQVTIYNRWGSKLYESIQGAYATKPWNGTYNGSKLPVGSYYFVIEFNVPDTEPEKGVVSIVLE